MVDYRDTEAPFNMAIATLKRLDTILQQIRQLDLIYQPTDIDKQKSYMGLVKQFYINAVPLLGENVKTYKEEVLKFEMKKKLMIKSGVQIYVEVYDKVMEKRFNEILIELQQKLSKFFMPKGKDLSKSVSNLG